jgi:hypothetical protein
MAAISFAPSRRRVVTGGIDIAAVVLNTTSCSATRIRSELGCVESTADGADPTSGVAVAVSSL